MPRTNQSSSGGCKRACKQCIPKNGQSCPRACPSGPVYREFHQGVIMSGAGKPPNSQEGVGQPDPKCFLYGTWYDFENNILYIERRNLAGRPIGYDAFENGQDLLLQFKLTNPTNPGTLGSVLESNSIFALQQCINAEAALLAPTRTRNALSNAARILNGAIKNANLGSIGFIFGNPPIPLVLDQLQNNAGYTTTPDFWLTPGNDFNSPPDEIVPFNGFQDFGWTLFVRDKRNNRYYRDSYNSDKNDPNFPPTEANPEHPCNGDLHVAFGLIFEFDADTCRWYLLDATEEVLSQFMVGTEAINQGLGPEPILLEDNWRRNCKC